MRITIRNRSQRLRAATRAAGPRLRARADRQTQAGSPSPDNEIDFSPVHGRHCICDRCQTARAAHPERKAA